MNNYNKHLSLLQRLEIESYLSQGFSFKHIASLLHKDASSISKEIKKNHTFSLKGAVGRNHNACINRYNCEVYGLCKHFICKKQNCKYCKECNKRCSSFEEEQCPTLQKPPYVCNPCTSKQKCTLRKKHYDGSKAHVLYQERLVEARSGISITFDEASSINTFIQPLIENGQSIHHIVSNNKDFFTCSERTIYNYVDRQVFNDVRNIDLPRKVKYKLRKKVKAYKVDKACRLNRTYEDFLKYRNEHHHLSVVQIDSVEGVKGGKVLLTIMFETFSLQLGFIRDRNDAASVINVFQHLYNTLGSELYEKLFPIILADNGTEFSNPSALEQMGGSCISKVFYTDPSSPEQKGACEKNHVEVRRILPKGTSFNHLTQTLVEQIFSHINSYTRKKLNDKSPHESFSFIYGSDVLPLLGIVHLPANEVILSPKLLQKNID